MTLKSTFNTTADRSNVVTLDFAQAAAPVDDGATRKNLRRMATQLGKKFGQNKLE